MQIAASWAILFGKSALDASAGKVRAKNSSSGFITHTPTNLSQETGCVLTEVALDGAARGRVDLATVVLDALGQLDEGGVSGEAPFSAGR